MRNSVPRTALPGRSWSTQGRLAKGLGFFSIALGILELAAPRALCRAIGVDGHETVVRAYGAREIANGIAILTTHDATPWVWGRVAGDGLDIATVLAGSRDGTSGKENTLLGLAVLVGVTALDVLCATGLTREKGGPRTALSDYRDRSGFPQGAHAARGAARDFQTPRDFRAPEPLRPEVFEQSRRRTGVASVPAS
jgi:hypothetical protein